MEKDFRKNFLNKKRGFILSEKLILLSIIIILIGAAIPFIQDIRPNIKLSGAARELATDLRWAEQSAVAEQVDYEIVFYPNSVPPYYQIFAQRKEGPEIVKKKDLSEGIYFAEINCEENKVVFNPYGAASSGGIVTLVNSEFQTTTIKIRPSGFIRTD